MSVDSIGTNSRDHADISTWEDQLAAESETGECYNDSEFDESVTIDDTDPTDVTLTVASGERHDGTAGTGARVVSNTATIIFDSATPSISYEWLELDANQADPDTANRIALLNIDQDTGGGAVRGALLHGMYRSSFNGTFGLQTRPKTGLGGIADFDVLNTIVYDNKNSRSGRKAANCSLSGKSSNTSGAVNAFNITAHSIVNGDSTDGDGIEGDMGGGDLRNCLSTSAEFDDFSASDITTESHNASSDATASGTGSLTNITTADQYVSTVSGSEDLHIQDTSADIFEAGTDLGTTPSGVELDIDGYDRDANNSTWSIGADQGETLSAPAAAGFPFQLYYGGLVG